MADRPILLRGIEQIHEHIFGADARVLTQQFCDPAEQRLLLLRWDYILSLEVRERGPSAFQMRGIPEA